MMPRNGLLEHGEAAGKQLRGWTSMWARGKSRVCSSTTTPPVAIRWGLWIFCRRTQCVRGRFAVGAGLPPGARRERSALSVVSGNRTVGSSSSWSSTTSSAFSFLGAAASFAACTYTLTP